jgi:uncharacterized protein
MQHWELIIFFLIISSFHSSVGFGGGSSFLAILSFYALPFQEVKFVALLCNLLVVTGGTLNNIANNQIDWKKIAPLVIVSAPAAFLGARVPLHEELFRIILGATLLIAAGGLWFRARKHSSRYDFESIKPNAVRDAALGGSIGFLAGMVGLGGGIFLSPILNIMKWDTPKKVAATSGFFILINSVSGIAGQLTGPRANINYVFTGILLGTVIVGGQIGSYVGINKLSHTAIKRVTAMLVLLAGLELLQQNLSWF